MNGMLVGYLLGSVDMNEYWYCVGAGKQHNRGKTKGNAPHVKIHKEKKKKEKEKKDKDKKKWPV